MAILLPVKKFNIQVIGCLDRSLAEKCLTQQFSTQEESEPLGFCKEKIDFNVKHR